MILDKEGKKAYFYADELQILSLNDLEEFILEGSYPERFMTGTLSKDEKRLFNLGEGFNILGISIKGDRLLKSLYFSGHYI